LEYLALLTSAFVSISPAGNSYEGPGATVPDEVTGGLGPVWEVPGSEVFSTGPWMNSTGTGAGGKDESILQAWGNTYGYGCQFNIQWVLADDFEVPVNVCWSVVSISIAGYQTGSGTAPTFDGLYFTLYDDPPTTGSIVYGDYTSNYFSSAAWTEIYRVDLKGAGTNTDRPIMAVTAELSTPWYITEGTYWLAYMLDGSGYSGPWSPPVVIWDQPVTGNALQSTDGGILWEPIENGGHASGVCIILEGDDISSLEHETWGSIKSMF